MLDIIPIRNSRLQSCAALSIIGISWSLVWSIVTLTKRKMFLTFQKADWGSEVTTTSIETLLLQTNRAFTSIIRRKDHAKCIETYGALGHFILC